MIQTRWVTYFVVSEFRECVDDDTKDDVESNRGDDDEEWYVEDGFEEMIDEGFTVWDFQELWEAGTSCTHISLKTSMVQMNAMEIKLVENFLFVYKINK